MKDFAQAKSSESAGILLDNRWGFVQSAIVNNSSCIGVGIPGERTA
jgi:hypothetical protein